MTRITRGDLLRQVATINNMCGTPQEPYRKDDNGKHHPNAGCYHLDWAYGGVGLQQMDTEGGTGTRDVIPGYGTKRELLDKMRAFIAGIEADIAHHGLTGE